MSDLVSNAYPWLKSLHVISVILWMGAQFLLPFLLAAQRGLSLSCPQAILLTHIERKLIHRIMNPAMLGTFVFGVLLASAVVENSGHIPRWLGIKLGLVFVLAALHGKLLRQFWRASEGRVQWTATGYRFVQWLNFVLMVGIVCLVVARPGR